MEFSSLGEHCSYEGCHQLDFLPFTCNACEQVFCVEHRRYREHACPAAGPEQSVTVPQCPLCEQLVPLTPGDDPNFVIDDHISRGCPQRKRKANRCSVKGCNKSELVPVVCLRCRGRFCLMHRHETSHDCHGARDAMAAAVEARAAKALAAKSLMQSQRPSQGPSGGSVCVQSASAAAGIAKTQGSAEACVANIPPTLSRAGAGAGQVALGTTYKGKLDRAALVKLKLHAEGIPKKLQTDKRFYLRVLYTEGKTSSKEVYVDRQYTVGKVIDLLASAAKLDNRNNVVKSGDGRLGLFLGRSGVALPTNVPLSMLSGDDFGDGVLVVLHRGEVLPPQIQGKLWKEALEGIVSRGCDPRYGYFHQTDDHEVYPNPFVLSDDHYRHLDFIGKMIGKAIYDGILLELPLSSFLRNKILGRHSYLDDLKSLDPVLHRNLMSLRTYQGNVADLTLDFTVTDAAYGVVREVELVPGGASRPVTSDNLTEYIYRMANYRLNVQMRNACAAFVDGIHAVVRPEWLAMFSKDELQRLISGADVAVDIDDFRENVVLRGYTQESDVINWFFETFEEMTVAQQRATLRFITSVSRPPLLGFSQLNPRIGIQCVHLDGERRLPSAGTCFNLLKLPEYGSKEELRAKLLKAIELGGGFHLS